MNLHAYVVNHRIAVLTQKQSTFPCTSYIENCCKTLYNTAESPYDKYMLHIIKLQVLAEKIDQLSVRHAAELATPGSAAELYVTSLKTGLETFRADLPFDLYEYRELLPRCTPSLITVMLMSRLSLIDLLCMQFHTAELCLYQLSLSAISEPVSSHTLSGQSFENEFLWAALLAAEATLNVYMSIPFGSETAFNNTQWVQIGFAMLVGSKLIYLACSTPALGTAVAQRKISWLSTLEQMRLRVNALSISEEGRKGSENVFHYFQARVVYIQKWFNRQSADTAVPMAKNTHDILSDVEIQPGFLADTNFEDLFTFPQDELLNVAIDQMMDNWV